MNEIFSIRLREARGSRSQSEVCAALGLKQGTYSTWELGKYEPTFDVLVRLATFLGVSTDWLLGMPVNPQAERTAQAKLECVKKAFFKLNEAFKELEGAL